MGKVKELSNQKSQMVVDLHKSGNGYKKTHKRLNIPLTTMKAMRWNSCKLARKRMQVHVVPTQSEEDHEGGKGEPKDRNSTTLVVSWGHKVSKSTIRHHLHTNRLFGRVAQRKPLLRATNKFKCLEFAKRHWGSL